MFEIHQQKGEIVKHVDAGQRVGEFEAVEQGRLAIEQADVAQMQIAVAAPHLAGRPAHFEQRVRGGQRCAPFFEDCLDALAAKPAPRTAARTW